ncbi:uL22m family ribosomal protein [Pseudonocardia sp.]|uniref:uL22m family ribosomal protein n=1 Tax=Pseudonocardia sp. TaxID=60912 RepID=UPI003D0F9FF8
MVPAGPADRVVHGRSDQVRIAQAEARRVLERVRGMPADAALHALRFAAGTVCAPVARVVQQATAEAARVHGIPPAALAVVAFEVEEGEPVVRVRRQAHGKADWITTRTTALTVELRSTGRGAVP